MELTLNGATVAIISLGVVILLAVVGGHMTLVFRVSKLPTREELHEVRNEARQDSIAIRAEMAAMRDEFRRDMAEMREDLLAAIRASEARIIKAIMDHRHPTPDAPPVFIEPV